MFQIHNSTASPAQPASTPAGAAGYFTNGNPAGGTAATIVAAEWLNAVMMELVNVVVAGGLVPTKNAFDQAAKAIKSIGKQRVILNDTDAANAYAAVNSPALVIGTWTDGIAQSVKIANANTGALTYSPDGLATIPIYGLGLQPLQGGGSVQAALPPWFVSRSRASTAEILSVCCSTALAGLSKLVRQRRVSAP